MKRVNLIVIPIFLMGIFLPFNEFFKGYEIVIGKLFDAFHFPFFFLFGVKCLKSGTELDDKTKLALLALAIVAVEMLQYIVGRSASSSDVMWGGMGLLCAYGHFSLSKLMAVAKKLLFVIYALSLCVSAYFLTMPYLYIDKTNGMDFSALGYMFKNVGDVESPELLIKEIDRGNRVLIGSNLSYSWSGFSYNFPIPVDLCHKSKVSLDLFINQPLASYYVRGSSPGGYKIWTINSLKSGWNKIYFNFNGMGSLDCHSVSSLSFYYETKSGPTNYMVDNILLN